MIFSMRKELRFGSKNDVKKTDKKIFINKKNTIFAIVKIDAEIYRNAKKIDRYKALKLNITQQ